jgi:17 kDa outer membrane surface antigen
MRSLGLPPPLAAFAAALATIFSLLIPTPAIATEGPGGASPRVTQTPAMPPDGTQSGGTKPGASAPCSCEDNKPLNHWPRPKFAEGQAEKVHLDAMDEIATLDAIRVALTEVGDGGSYVWHRAHGRLSGLITPTASFKDAAGNVCRHIVTVLSSGSVSRRAEGFACRLPDGRWQLDG